MWPEIEAAKNENKRELKLSGTAISERLAVQNAQLDPAVFALSALNLLNISETTLAVLPAAVSNLTNLQTLLLYGNQLTALPDELGTLDKLKVLDVSRNQIAELPASLAELTQLATVNFSNNRLATFPRLTRCSKLSVLDISNNQLTAFPDVCYESLSNLSELHAKDNRIEAIPAEIAQLGALKVLSLPANRLTVVPKVLAGMAKLKELLLADNPLADKRLYKLIVQCRTKQILDYVKQHGCEAKPRDRGDSTADGGADRAADDALPAAVAALTVGGRGKKPTAAIEHKHRLFVQRWSDSVVRLEYAEAVREIRPHILCCVVRNLRLDDAATLKRFLQLQTRLHETVCGRREKSTIATHDLAKIAGGFVRYTARPPQRLHIMPLGRSKPVTGQKLYDTLQAEAEALRKEKKRNVYSGIHKYLYLLARLPAFACLEDGERTVITLPPLTNCEQTKIGPETRNVLVEVTSGTSMADCRAAIEELLVEMLLGGFGAPAEKPDDAADGAQFEHTLIVQQVKCTDTEGNMRAVFPGKTDLLFEETRPAILVERESV